MKSETLLMQEMTNEVEVSLGGGPPRAASPEERAQLAKERVMAIYNSGVAPSRDHFVTKRADGTICACVMGSIAIGVGSKILAQKEVRMAESIGDYSVRQALIGEVCDATSEFSADDVLALEEGFMGWTHGFYSGKTPLAETDAFYRAGQEIAEKVLPRV